MKSTVALLAALALGFLLSYFGGFQKPDRAPIEPATNEYQEKYESLKAKMDKMSTVDIEEYLQLKDMKSRYQKADEILGKILMMMIADFGIRSSQTQLDNLKNNPVPAADSTSEVQKPNPSTASSEVAATAPQEVAAGSESNYAGQGSRAQSINSESELKNFLKSVEIKDFFSKLKTQRPVNRRQLELLNGTFDGEITFDQPEDPNIKVWQIEMMLNARRQGGKVIGSHSVRLLKQGRQFSYTHSDDKSVIDDIGAFPGDRNAIIVNAYGDHGYLQLYHLPQMNQITGLYYAKKSEGVFKRIGYVTLYKR